MSHLEPEIQVHLIGTIPNGMTVEYMPWSVRLFQDVPWPKDDLLTPGLGLTFDQEATVHFQA